ncbi:SIS domain-containing protein [Camelliibacillus cellulosilyticus]|uniref:SIS domain-containing protein n=1 Tax=Camelliibacillus cellulosilyticus TaxID=2174486 RepID=A0ABV9GLD2_9BACL
MLLDVSEEKSKSLGVYHTQKEIAQQPVLWEQTFERFIKEKPAVQAFLAEILKKHHRVRVILTGAGTSAFVGECVIPYLKTICNPEHYVVEAIPTTDIVSNPTSYLSASVPTIMVSFARSGDSPESVAAVKLGEKLIRDFYQINITCNKDGYLAKQSKNDDRALLLLMPEASNDQGFAMTGSFTCMTLAALLIFQMEKLEAFEAVVRQMKKAGEALLENALQTLQTIADIDFSNIVYLGSGPFHGLAHEASLKMLELTGGKVFTAYESSLGFRHGPKSMLNDRSLVMMMVSGDPYTRKYDVDMLKELYEEKAHASINIVAMSSGYDKDVEASADYYFYDNGHANEEDVWSIFPYIMYGQILAFYKSVQLGLKPDNPSPSGSVNRVVKGVTIHPL